MNPSLEWSMEKNLTFSSVEGSNAIPRRDDPISTITRQSVGSPKVDKGERVRLKAI